MNLRNPQIFYAHSRPFIPLIFFSFLFIFLLCRALARSNSVSNKLCVPLDKCHIPSNCGTSRGGELREGEVRNYHKSDVISAPV